MHLLDIRRQDECVLYETTYLSTLFRDRGPVYIQTNEPYSYLVLVLASIGGKFSPTLDIAD